MNNPTLRRVCWLLAVTALFNACSLVGPTQTSPAPRRVPHPQPPSQPQPGQTPSVPTPSQPVPPEVTPTPTTPREHQLGLASKALVAQAQSQTASGDFAVAAGTIERALRIEPDNPLLWIELGKVRYASGNYSQAEHTARKALSLAAGDLKTQSAAWQLIAKSLRARGRAEEALQADARANALMPQ